MSSGSGKHLAPTQAQLNRLVPYTPSEKKWFDYYLNKASGQKNPQYTKNFKEGGVKPMIISEVESAIDQASSEAALEKKNNTSSVSQSKPVKRKQSTTGKGPKSKKKKSSVPKDIFSK